jgi:hypothetical protein
MTITLRRLWIPLLAVLVPLAALPAAAQVPVMSNDGPAMAAFEQQLAAYVELRSRLEEPLPSFTPSRGIWSTLLAKQYLASAIRAARRGGRGAIFSPDVALAFRQRVVGALTPAERLLLAGGEDGADVAPPPIVNEPLPPEWMATAPAAVVHRLPELPAAIEYRFVGYDLVLWDAHADIVIDVLSDALR